MMAWQNRRSFFCGNDPAAENKTLSDSPAAKPAGFQKKLKCNSKPNTFAP
jgi:hypothetical protein